MKSINPYPVIELSVDLYELLSEMKSELIFDCDCMPHWGTKRSFERVQTYFQFSR